MRLSSQSFEFASLLKPAYNRRMTATWLIFTILSMLRNKIAPAQISPHLQRIGVKLAPRIHAWLSICRSYGLLNARNHPTGLFHQWLAWPEVDKTFALLTAWQKSPQARKNRMWRQRILRRLMRQQPLCPADQAAIPALQAIGICHENGITLWGKTALGLRPAPSPLPPARWEIINDTLRIPYPVDWKLLWQLESFLSPYAPLLYRLDAAALRLAAQRGHPAKLLEILQSGLGAAAPAEIRAGILGQPTLQVTTGLILEFSDPAELRRLRSTEPLRSHFEQILSPRHILVNEKNAPRLLKLLERRGIYMSTTPPIPILELGERKGDGPGRTHFSHAHLLEPLGKNIPILEFLRQSIHQQLAFDMLYNAPDSQRPEIHRVTPVLIEERAGYTYVIAYSHTRKGQRTYRLDRMEIPGTVPC